MRFMKRFIVTFASSALVVSAVVAAAWVLVAPPAKAEFPGQNGRIAFMRQDRDGFWQTWVADKDLSNQHKLTSGQADSGWAVWKPGGAKLAFDSNRADPDPSDQNTINDVFKMNPEGTGLLKLTHSDSYSSDAGWSPDGKKIAFASDRRNGGLWPPREEIYVMDSDGSHVHRLSTLPESALLDTAPRFSPDGNQLVFTRYSKEPGRTALFTVGVDGSGLKQLTPYSNGAGDADYSPDGKKLVFEAYPNKNCYGEIYTVDSDGQNLTNITDNGCKAASHDPVWSPDGKTILFADGHAFSGGFGFGLATMNPDGTDREFILPNPATDDAEWEHQPDWESVR
jgi:Tol biopolymer transport system component